MDAVPSGRLAETQYMPRMHRPVMKTAIWVGLTLTALAFAGCTEDPAPPLTDDDCRVQGLILDPAVEQVDNETGETFVGPACVEDVPSVTVHLEGVPETTQAWFPVELTWVMHTTLDTDHSHNNGIRVSTTSDPSYLGKLDGYGEGIPDGKQEHRDFVEGDSSTVTWTPEEPGTYYVRAYAVSAWGNYWAPEHEVVVTEVTPTGTIETVTVSALGVPPGPSIDKPDLTINIGDEVQWASGDPAGSWTIERSSGPRGTDPFQTTTDGEGVVFTVPGAYRYTAYQTELGEEVAVEGSITVVVPE